MVLVFLVSEYKHKTIYIVKTNLKLKLSRFTYGCGNIYINFVIIAYKLFKDSVFNTTE